MFWQDDGILIKHIGNKDKPRKSIEGTALSALICAKVACVGFFLLVGFAAVKMRATDRLAAFIPGCVSMN